MSESVVVITVTQPTRTVTIFPTSSGQPSSNVSGGAISGIVIGTLFGGILVIALVLYLLNRYNRHKFSRVANPAYFDAERAHLSSTRSRGPKLFARHPQRPFVSSEPLMSPASWQPLPTTSRVLSPDSRSRVDSILPEIRYSAFNLDVINPAVASDTTIPAHRASPVSSLPGLGDTPPHTRETSGDGATSPPMPPKSPPTLFLHRMLKSRAQASEGVALAHRFSSSRSATLDSSTVHGDEERLLTEAERSALRDAERAQRGEMEEMAEEDDDWEEVPSTESMYSQGSAPLDHSGFFSEPVSHQNSTLSVHRRGSSRRRPRMPAPSTELSPVTEVPDTPRVLVEGQAVSRPGSTVANSSLDAQGSHGTADPPGGNFPLLTSTSFGKDSSATSGGSSSSGRTSRYPSLAPSSLGLSSQSGPRSDAGTDWHNPPSGLAGLTSLQIGLLRNPHSPVEERRETAEPAPMKRARLREGTASSLPEVERRDVLHGGIADIDVAL